MQFRGALPVELLEHLVDPLYSIVVAAPAEQVFDFYWVHAPTQRGF